MILEITIEKKVDDYIMDEDNDQEYQRHRMYRFPYFRLIFLLIVGIVLILLGLSSLFGIDVWHYIWPVIAIILGLVIILGVIFGQRRRY